MAVAAAAAAGGVAAAAYREACAASGTPPVAALEAALAAAEGAAEPLALNMAGNTVAIQVTRRKLGDRDMSAVLAGASAARLPVAAVYAGWNVFTDAGAEAWAPPLARSGVRLVDVSSCDLGPRGAVALVAALAAGARELQVLCLDHNAIGDAGGAAVAALMEAAPALSSVSLASCELGMDAVIQLAAAVAASKTLQHLNLSNPRIHTRNEEAAYHIARALRVNRSLTSLVLRSWPQWTETSVASLCDYLLDNDGVLTDLDLSGNRFAGPAGVVLARTLEAGAALRCLRLAHCRVTDEGAVALATALLRGCSLRELDVRHNSIGDVGLAALAEAIAGRATDDDAAGTSALDALMVEGNALAAGRAGTTALGQLLLEGATSCMLDVRPYVVDGVVHLGIVPLGS